MKITYNAFHYGVISRRLIIHAHGNEYLWELQLRSSYGRAAPALSISNLLIIVLGFELHALIVVSSAWLHMVVLFTKKKILFLKY